MRNCAFKLAALKVGDFTSKIIVANSHHTIPTQHTMQIKVVIVSVFMPFNI